MRMHTAAPGTHFLFPCSGAVHTRGFAQNLARRHIPMPYRSPHASQDPQSNSILPHRVAPKVTNSVIALLNLRLFGSRRLCRAPGLIMRAETIIRYKTKVDSRAFSYARILANCTHIARIAFVLPLLGTCLHTVRPGPYTAHWGKQK
jgi:hypothetical protein